ncbi:hypothetical protein [Roseibium salinum]|uniref:Uncharacterized protein n=1 Tax=Roseibium salinum TaxID=1604349 RepID=A0ABT3QVU9_9HYPH|nr:hypothetical protein [Roseibium sp. DSM 29163]MCX2721054.1 hypothetical protein [Roseibium sp. DSM 29163]
MTLGRSLSPGLVVIAAVAVLFGALTVLSGGVVLFGGEEATQAAGNVVRFVLWFNFLAGFAYIVAGVGLFLRKRWAYWLAAAIVASTVAVFAAFAIHVLQGGAYEMRTLAALTLRTVVWAIIARIAFVATGASRTAP